MALKKNPPFQKVFEAYSAIADGRVEMMPGERRARVMSSEGDKVYTVQWSEDEGVYRSNDSATFWQGYPGYPVIAVLMLQGKVPFSEDDAQLLSGVDWAAANKASKRDYDAALEGVLDERGISGEQRSGLVDRSREAYGILCGLDIATGRCSEPVEKK
jgi:hypothetical protein